MNGRGRGEQSRESRETIEIIVIVYSTEPLYYLPKKYGLVCSYEVMMIRWRTSYKYNIDVLIGFLQCREQYSESTWRGYNLTGPPERVNLNRIVKSLVPYDRLKKCGVKCDQIYIITRLV